MKTVNDFCGNHSRNAINVFCKTNHLLSCSKKQFHAIHHFINSPQNHCKKNKNRNKPKSQNKIQKSKCVNHSKIFKNYLKEFFNSSSEIPANGSSETFSADFSEVFSSAFSSVFSIFSVSDFFARILAFSKSAKSFSEFL